MKLRLSRLCEPRTNEYGKCHINMSNILHDLSHNRAGGHTYRTNQLTSI